ncbi:hypothetical protein [Shewanella sp. UCD-KL12]|uniref:hypothetical protein n=1 Tax=Shewanella sp. UCD-KL12 TaxID=1917163 RepID=UPI0015C39C2A|nr:hypothetical protein [Shewanella sp. UCD-KL12]
MQINVWNISSTDLAACTARLAIPLLNIRHKKELLTTSGKAMDDSHLLKSLV